MHEDRKPYRHEGEKRSPWSSSDYLVLEGLSGLDEEFGRSVEEATGPRLGTFGQSQTTSATLVATRNDMKTTARVSLPADKSFDFSPDPPSFDAMSAFRTARERRAAQEREAAHRRSAVRRKETNELRKYEPEFMAFFSEDPATLRKMPEEHPPSSRNGHGQKSASVQMEQKPGTLQPPVSLEARTESARSKKPLQPDWESLDTPSAPEKSESRRGKRPTEDLEAASALAAKQTVLPKPRKTRPAAGDAAPKRLVSPEPIPYDNRLEEGDDSQQRRRRSKATFLPAVICSFLLTTLFLLALAFAFLNHFGVDTILREKIQAELSSSNKDVAVSLDTLKQAKDEHTTLVEKLSQKQDQFIKLATVAERAKQEDDMGRFKELERLMAEVHGEDLRALIRGKQNALLRDAATAAKNHSLQIGELFAGNKKVAKETDVTAGQLVEVMSGSDFPLPDRVRAACLLREHGTDRKAVASLARAAFDQNVLSLALVAYDSLAEIADFKADHYDPDGVKAALQLNIEDKPPG